MKNSYIIEELTLRIMEELTLRHFMIRYMWIREDKWLGQLPLFGREETKETEMRAAGYQWEWASLYPTQQWNLPYQKMLLGFTQDRSHLQGLVTCWVPSGTHLRMAGWSQYGTTGLSFFYCGGLVSPTRPKALSHKPIPQVINNYPSIYLISLLREWPMGIWA